VAGGALATRHLLQQGCRHIAFLGDPQLPEVALRHRGHLQELQAQGLQADPRLLVSVPFEASVARAAVSRLCEQGPPFDALIACSDVLAMAAVQALRGNGREVPGSVAVVGYDDIEWASHADPPLTTVRQPIAAAGAQMVDALLAQLEGAQVPPMTLEVELVVRQSSQRTLARVP
jgi:DNA-binding LacI/PurR family transcriptional regulator